MKKIVIWLRNFIKIINRDNIFVYSAQASFFIIISALPAAMLFLSLLKYILPLESADILLLSKNIFPSFLLPITQAVLKEVLGKASLPLISITALSSLWTASRGFLAIERGVRSVFGLTSSRSFILNAIYSIVYTIIFILIMATILVFFTFGSAIIDFWTVKSKWVTIFFGQRSPIKWGASLTLVSVLFSTIYTVFSGRIIGFFRQIPGALFTTVGWLIFSVLYSIYIENFANYSYVYGSLTAVILMMLWVYFCMIIFLIGAEINKVIFKKIK